MWPFKKKQKIDIHFPPKGAAKNWTEDERDEFINKLAVAVGQQLIFGFHLFDLKTHIQCGMINEPTGEMFELTFRKINTPKIEMK